MANRSIYHYVIKRREGNKTTSIDGIVLMVKRIVSQDDYHALKNVLAMSDTAVKDGWIIESLSYLGREREPGAKA